MSDQGHARENAWAGQGAVLLDIGGDVGALVVEMPARLTGVEVEARPSGVRRGADPVHVAVVARPVAGGAVPSLVFPGLPAGRYELRLLGGAAGVTHGVAADVCGGAVTTLAWPDDRQ